MMLSKEKLLAQASATGFRPEMLEKSLHLLSLLENISSHPFLKGRLALKGGTALNLFILDVPRLSVDIDLNYVGARDPEVIESERGPIEQALKAICDREGFGMVGIKKDHAGWRVPLRYGSAFGSQANMKLDVNFMLRTPLWPVVQMESRVLGDRHLKKITLLDVHELAAGKLAALFSRHASRDLFDAHHLLTRYKLNPKRLRLGFVLYGAMHRKDWRTISINHVEFDPKALKNELLPLLQIPAGQSTYEKLDWVNRMVDECRQALSVVFPLADAEIEFLDRLLDHGEIEPSLLTKNKVLTEIVLHHPLLQWKANNVRKFKKPKS